MLLNRTRLQRYLRSFDFTALFVEELGWDRATATDEISIEDRRFELRAVAEKHGVIALVCRPLTGTALADAATWRAIEARVAPLYREHMIIFADALKTQQVWQWVKRDADGPPRYIEHRYHSQQSGESLIQKLQTIAFSLEKEERITLVDVLERLGAAFTERVTKRFYQRFKLEHAAFLSFIQGFQNVAEREWYASLMLNRLMFIYFFQKRGSLAGDPDYLRNRLLIMQRRSGRDQFITFYRHFLLRLFHEGLGHRSHSPELDALLGDVPYFNSGLFDRHELERDNSQLEIPDEAFARIFDFFDSFDWVLDDRPISDDREINPDVLGYVFEQYINKKQMGAYYTQEDITGYIARNTIIPALFDAAACGDPDATESRNTAWDRLHHDSDRYIKADVLKGVDLPLPDRIAIGQQHIALRAEWNKPAEASYALANETWREHIARRTHCQELRARLSRGDIRSINDLITYNLDIGRFAQDVIAQCKEPSELRSIHRAIERISILDPTCGSGAFLLAALTVLEPLYAACLARMEWFVRTNQLTTQNRPIIETFSAILANVARHPSRDYFIRKSIVINNLYGVDIMKEAVEICKLRLFLKVVAPIADIREVEPLPDIDFNFRAGNTLVGFASHAAVRRMITGGVQGKLDIDDNMQRIDNRAEAADRLFQQFRAMQIAYEVEYDQLAAKKLELRHALHTLRLELDQYLAGEYGISTAANYTQRYEQWRNKHQPFQWYAEFYGIVRQGGFDVIIGNPPYVMHSKIRHEYSIRDYRTEPCGNLYAFVMERSLALLREHGRCGMILPIASVSTQGMCELQALYNTDAQWHSHYAVRPGKLFAGVDMNLTISLFQKTNRAGRGFTTKYHRWSNGVNSERPYLFNTLTYICNPSFGNHANAFPKLGSQLEINILQRMLAHNHKLRQYVASSGATLYYHSGGRYWRKALPSQLSSHYKPITVQPDLSPVVFALLNSQLFYWYWISNSNCMDLVSREVLELPVFSLTNADVVRFAKLEQRLLSAYYESSTTRIRQGERINVEEINFDVRQAKPVIDEIDSRLGDYYGFSGEELDFILNYDIKYRAAPEEWRV
jgi:hypothetical protein